MQDTLFSKTKWSWRSPSVDKASVEQSLAKGTAWSGNNMYRTSYNDMSKKVSGSRYARKRQAMPWRLQSTHSVIGQRPH